MQQPAFSRRRAVLFGKDSDSIIKSFFGSSATVAIVVLTLITIFLFKEGAGFIRALPQEPAANTASPASNTSTFSRKSAMAIPPLTRYLNDVRAEWINSLKTRGKSQKEISKAVMAPEAKALFMGYMRVGSDLRRFHQREDGCRHRDPRPAHYQ